MIMKRKLDSRPMIELVLDSLFEAVSESKKHDKTLEQPAECSSVGVEYPTEDDDYMWHVEEEELVTTTEAKYIEYKYNPLLTSTLFSILMHNLLCHIKFDECLYGSTSGMIDVRNNYYYESDMIHLLAIIMDDKDRLIADFMTAEKSRIKNGGNISGFPEILKLYENLAKAYRERRFEEYLDVLGE